MDPVQAKLCEELWCDLQKCLVLSASIRTLLDYLHSSVLNANTNHWYSLLDQNQEELFKRIRSVIKGHNRGYEVLLAFVDRPEYASLRKKYTDRLYEEEAIRKECDKALRFGNVPSMPRFYIERSSLMNEIKSKITEMSSKVAMKINIHGMNGIGKSNLAAACIRDSNILKRIKYKVYWIDLQNRHQENDLIDQMYMLYHRLQLVDSDTRPQDKPATIGIMKNMLQALFIKAPYDNALIVLDNVPNIDVIQHFDVCRLLILSQEKFQLEERMLHVYLQDLFTAEETKDLFQQALDAPLPENDYVKDVVTWCKGDPMTVVLCANVIALQAEGLKTNAINEWEHFRNRLVKRSKIPSKRHQTIKFCLANLSDDLHEKFLDLGIFAQDVNITANPLSLLWDLNEPDVDEIMLSLMNKSLVVRGYNESNKAYVYGIHHVFYSYLRDNVKDLQERHKALVNAYLDKYIHYHKFADDNYIYQYISYHLYNAGMTQEFEIFRKDLRFLEAKIQAAGIGDVIHDLDNYTSLITLQCEEYELLVEQLEKFLHSHGQNLERFKHTSIIQSALQLPPDNLVYQLARKEMKRAGQFGLYFKWLSPKKNKCHIQDLNVSEKFHIACFTSEAGYLLIGTESGDIQLWAQRFNQNVQTFRGHTDKITHLRADDDRFLSISRDGSVKLWKLRKRRNSFSTANNECGFVPSPAVKQRNHQNFFGDTEDDEAYETHTCKDDVYVTADLNGDMLVAGSAKGKLVWWKNGNLVHEMDLKQLITSVQFSMSTKHIYLALKSGIVVYDTASGEFVSKIFCDVEILALHTLQHEDVEEFVAIQKSQVVKCTIVWKEKTPFLDKTLIMKLNDAANICSSMTDKYLVIGTSNKTVYMWDLQKREMVEQFDAQYGNVICIDAVTNYDDNTIEILLTGFGNNILKLWHINPGETFTAYPDVVQMYAAHWLEDKNTFEVATARKNVLSISQKDPRDISFLGHVTKLLTYNQTFVLGCQTGMVCMYVDGKVEEIMDLGSEVSYLEAFDGTIVAASTSGSLLVHYQGSAYKLQDGERQICTENRSDSIRTCFKFCDNLIVISERKICYWKYSNHFSSIEVLCGKLTDCGYYTVACKTPDNRICVASGNNLLALTIDESMNYSINKVHADNDITSCCCSQNNIYLALGTKCGEIEIWCLETMAFHSKLRAHEAPVTFMTFSSESSILFSLAEQMIWWNVSLSVKTNTPNNKRRSFRSRSNSGACISAKKPLAPLDLENAVMLTKRGKEGKEYLLSAIKLYGARASYIAHSDNFTAFLCIDDLGNVYNLRLIEAFQADSPDTNCRQVQYCW